jgi:soluble lytic murein transglycosylase-like protein
MTSGQHSSPRAIARLAGAGLTGALMIGLLPGLGSPASAAGLSTARSTAQPVAATHDRLPPGRKLVAYTVRPGDTATELAVRFHAWTAELISLNHLGSGGTMYVGQRLRIPVVVSAVRKERRKAPRAESSAKPVRKHAKRWHHADPSREKVRRIIVRTARREGVDPQLALAISWQEAGWQMHHVSSANAIGAMQVIPTTGIWMSMYAGRLLRLRDVHDNVLAGVLLLRVLNDHTSTRRRQIAAYYQGLGAVREHGLYPETRRYVANVRAIKQRLERGRPPA